MNPFTFERARDVESAIASMGRIDRRELPPGSVRFLAGGTNLVDLMKENIAHPLALIDILALPLRDVLLDAAGNLKLGALARNAETAEHPLVAKHAPLLRAAILAGASPQIRNMATNGGNLLQRTRCYYFYDTGVPCNKRERGSGCPAIEGLARQHAILGASEHCVATHPSDMCVALAALDAVVHVRSPGGPRDIAFVDFHRLPGDRPDIDTLLARDELITHLTIPANPFAMHCSYLKIRERASYAFALVSVAAALDLADDGTVRDARLALGGVAHKPWRDRAVELSLVGRRPDRAAFGDAADLLLQDARPTGGPAAPENTPGNAFKIPLARRAIVRAFEMALAGETSNTGRDAFASLGNAGGAA